MISVSCLLAERRASRVPCISKRRTSTRAWLTCQPNIRTQPNGCWLKRSRHVVTRRHATVRTADDESRSNLERMRAAGVDFRYHSVDVTDAAATHEAVREVERDLGPVTAILHGAARNVPCLIENLNSEAIAETVAPKIRGAQNLLTAINPDHLRLFITFSSIIARTGLPGEAHYGLANEWLTRLTTRWQTTHPHCRCLAIEWSVWSGVGMGARLGTVDTLVRTGITAIPVEKGVDSLRKLLCRKSAN